MKSWRDFIKEKEDVIVPWTGEQNVYTKGRRWKIQGRRPEEHGWHIFQVGTNKLATWNSSTETPFDWEKGQFGFTGYMVGNRVIPDNSSVVPDPEKIIEQTIEVGLVDPGMERFSRGYVVHWEKELYLFGRQEFPMGPESEVVEAFLERKSDISSISGVTPALDLAFRFESLMRTQNEERRRLLEEQYRKERERLEKEERLRTLEKSLGSGSGRRQMALVNFEEAARAALLVSGAVLLDQRPSTRRSEYIVQFRHEQRRFECVVDNSLHIVDAGICLNGHDRMFTLESLPGVISEAIKSHRLHVFRRVDSSGYPENNVWDMDVDEED